MKKTFLFVTFGLLTSAMAAQAQLGASPSPAAGMGAGNSGIVSPSNTTSGLPSTANPMATPGVNNNSNNLPSNTNPNSVPNATNPGGLPTPVNPNGLPTTVNPNSLPGPITNPGSATP